MAHLLPLRRHDNENCPAVSSSTCGIGATGNTDFAISACQRENRKCINVCGLELSSLWDSQVSQNVWKDGCEFLE